jgi:hypothetical protein
MEDIWKEQVFPILATLGLNLKRNGAGTITARIKKKRDSLWFNHCKNNWVIIATDAWCAGNST